MRYFWCGSLFIVTGVNTVINPSNAVIGLDSFAVVERRAAHSVYHKSSLFTCVVYFEFVGRFVCLG